MVCTQRSYATSSIESEFDPEAASDALPFPFAFFGRAPLPLMLATSCASGSSVLMPEHAQDAKTVADRTDSSARLWRRFDTVSPPEENARSASTLEAERPFSYRHMARVHHSPGTVRRSRAMRASGEGSSACQYLIGSSALVTRGIAR